MTSNNSLYNEMTNLTKSGVRLKAADKFKLFLLLFIVKMQWTQLYNYSETQFQLKIMTIIARTNC